MANEILKEELLSEDQLEDVAGGTSREIQKDADFMQAVGVLRQGESGNDALQRAFASQGISVIFHGDDNLANEYYKGGKQITREQALNTVMKYRQPGQHQQLHLIVKPRHEKFPKLGRKFELKQPRRITSGLF